MTALPAAAALLQQPLPEAAVALQPFIAAEVLTEADVRLAERLGRLGGDRSPDVLLAAALALRAPRFGHVCVELGGVAERIAVEPRPRAAGAGLPDDAAPEDAALDAVAIADLPWPDLAAWTRTLAASRLVRTGGRGTTPLVLEHGRLYLDRYWHYEQRLADALTARAADRVAGVDPTVLAGWLDDLFAAPRTTHGVEPDGPPATSHPTSDPTSDAPQAAPGLDRQRLAVALALLRRLAVIAGGPGTGKTYTVTRVLALLHIHALATGREQPLRVALAAPTGKAAARLQQSLAEGLAELTLDPVIRDAMTRTPAFTLHRLLGRRRDSDSRFRHDAAHPLPYDVVIVDEASMVSLPLMAKLVDAVRPDARLVLLGDRDQLASVEAGAAFGDLCGPDGSRPVLRLSPGAVTELGAAVGTRLIPHVTSEDAPGVWDAIVRLDRIRRFDGQSHLGRVADAIQRIDEDPDAALALLRQGAPTDDEGVQLRDPEADPTAQRRCEDEVVATYAAYAALALEQKSDPQEVLHALDALRVLCALRRGPDGAWAWNAAIEGRLARDVPGFRTDQTWYVGRPILIRENDYGVRLYNGDVGVILADPDQPDRRLAAFPATDGSIRMLSPARLPACETTFAMTIHKSQGSQFDHAVVVLPRVTSPVLTRELVYTAITRAKRRTTLLAREPILREALARPVQRASGLQHRLWGA